MTKCLVQWMWVILPMLSACTVGPDYHAPRTEVPAQWIGAATTEPSTGPSRLSQGDALPGAWWRLLNDPTLDRLIDMAIARNLDLQSATASLRQARALRVGAGAGLFPTVGADAAFQRSRARGGSSAQSAHTGNLYQAGFDASWEIDLFGGVRRGIEAADADLLASVNDRRGVLVSLTSEVAVDYVQLRTLQTRLDITRRTLDAQVSTLAVTRKRRDAGFVSSLDVVNAEALLATIGAQVPALQAAQDQSLFELTILLGRQPGEIALADVLQSPVPGVPSVVPIGLPAQLLERRPDIRAAEARLHAATARVGVATADLYPRIALSGSIGLSAEHGSSLFNWGNRSWGFGPSAQWMILDFGKVRANIEAQDALVEQSLIAYRQTVLSALQETNSALSAYQREQLRRDALWRAVGANRRAVDLAERLYAQGQTEFLSLLDAQRSLYAAEDALAQSDQSVTTNLIALCKALGGGWQDHFPLDHTER